MIVVRLLVFERMVAAVAYMCSKPVSKARHAGHVYIMMYAILAFQQKQINVFFTLPFRGLVFHANVPRVGIIEKYVYTHYSIHLIQTHTTVKVVVCEL